MTNQYAEDIANGPDPDIEDTHDPSEDNEEEVTDLLKNQDEDDWYLKGRED